MKLHYMKKYNLDPDSLPHGEHMPGAVRFKEAESTKEMAVIANVSALVIMVILAVPAIMRCLSFFSDALGENMSDYAVELWVGSLLSLAILFPHEILHAICFKEDVYLYTNFRQGMLFVVGPETMSKGRFVHVYAAKSGIWNYSVHAWNDFSAVWLAAGSWHPCHRNGRRRLLQHFQRPDPDAEGGKNLPVQV